MCGVESIRHDEAISHHARTQSSRVVLVDLPRLLREIIRELLTSEPGVEVVGELPDMAALPAAVATLEPDLVIAREDGGGAAALALAARPAMRLLLVAGDGRRASLHELRPHRTYLGELSPGMLLSAARAAGQDPGPPID